MAEDRTDTGEHSTEHALSSLGRRFAAISRGLVISASGVVTLMTQPARTPDAAVAIVTATIVWNVVFSSLLYRRARRRLALVDTAFVCVVCLAQEWSGPPNSDFQGMTWTYAIAAITVVTIQLHTGWLAGTAVALVVVSAYLVGIAKAAPQTWTVEAPFALWMLVEALLARGLRVVVWREGRIADRLMSNAEQVRREAEVGRARRAAEQEHLAALHDTASATLLMVGAGVVAGWEPWLAAQARRDLDVIEGTAGVVADHVDLIGMLREVARLISLQVCWRTGAELRVPGPVASALCGATREALTNVVRHAGVAEAEITVDSGPSLVVEIVDRGRGFATRAVPTHRYGLSRSLSGRLTGVGGQASIVSQPGRGTRVRLEVPGDAA